MADRKVFVAALFTAVLLLAGAFTLPRFFFFFELAKSTIYFGIAVLVYYGVDRYGYMLGIIAPPLWFIVDIMSGTLFRDFRVLGDFLAGRSVAPFDTPLHALARVAAILLFIVSARAWRKEVPERVVGRTFWRGLAVSLVYVGVLTGWYFSTFSAPTRIP
jgi:hypothetical protein